jgi:hypothetical protein
MSQYPFNDMYEQVRQDVCDKNRDVRLPVNIKMFVRGKRGCVERDEEAIVDPVGIISVASNYELNCPARECGAFEPSPPLPRTRLPRHDLHGIGAQAEAETWEECRDRCERLDACRAWTWCAPHTSGALAEGAALCPLQSGADPRVSDPCCHSGIKGE